MPQQFLHDLEFRSYTSQKRRVGVPERVPANFSLDPNPLRNGANDISEDRLSPLGMTTAMVLIGKDPVIGFTVVTAFLPCGKGLREDRMDRNGLLGRFSFAATYYAIRDRPRHIHGALGKIDVPPFDGKQFTLAQAR